VDENFKTEYEYVMKDPILIGDFMTANPQEPEVIDPKVY